MKYNPRQRKVCHCTFDTKPTEDVTIIANGRVHFHLYNAVSKVSRRKIYRMTLESCQLLAVWKDF